MKKITKRQFESLELKKNNKVGSNLIMKAISELKIDEGLIVTKEEWKYKSGIQVLWGGFKHNRKLGIKVTIRQLADNSGWAVLRVK